ncbi:MAG: siphovirus Gp157 family protein [Peptostreptococcaceae bacterium]
MDKSISLYEMANDIIELVELEEVDEAQKAEIIESLKETMSEKAESIIAVIRSYETRIEGVRAEEKRLAEYRRSEEKKLEKLKEYTIYCLEQMGNKKIDTNLGRLSLRKKPTSLIVTDENQVPDIYKTVKEVISIDKTQIKKDLKEANIDGVELVEGGNSLVIK